MPPKKKADPPAATRPGGMVGYRKLLITTLSLLAVVGLTVAGRIPGDTAAWAIAAVATAYLTGNIIAERWRT